MQETSKPKSLDWRIPIPWYWLLAFALLISGIIILHEWVPYWYSKDTSGFQWNFTILLHLSNYVFWAIIAPVIYLSTSYVMRRWQRMWLRVAFILAIGIVAAGMHRVGASFLLNLANFVSSGVMIPINDPHAIYGIVIGLVRSFLEFWLLAGIFLMFDFYHRYREKELELVNVEKQLTRAELEALKLQLHPHFLFNTLNTVSALMEENTIAAQNMIARLAYLLRTLLKQQRATFWSLEKELEFTQAYLQIEQTRFRDRLEIRYDIDEACLGFAVPSLLLQPVVENAIRHGFAAKSATGSIEVIAKCDNGQLDIIIEDDGAGASSMFLYGVGLTNVRERLATMYGDQAVLIPEAKTPGFRVTIRMPAQILRDDDADD